MVQDVREAKAPWQWWKCSQVISGSTCEQNWQGSAHGHIHSKTRNRLELEATKMLVYVYSNSKMVAATGHANEHNMLAWTVHQMKMHRYNMTTSDHTPLRAPAGGSHSPGEARVAESLSRSF